MEISDWAAAPLPAEVKMSAGEIVKVLPSLSPRLSLKLLHFLQQGLGFIPTGFVSLHVTGREVEAVLEQVREGFTAQLESLLGPGGVVQEEGGSHGDVILEQLSFCLLLARLGTLPPQRVGVEIVESTHFQCTYGGEQAVEVLNSALVSQHWSNSVRQLRISGDGAFVSDRGCEHLAYLLKSGLCKLEELQMRRQTCRSLLGRFAKRRRRPTSRQA